MGHHYDVASPTDGRREHDQRKEARAVASVISKEDDELLTTFDASQARHRQKQAEERLKIEKIERFKPILLKVLQGIQQATDSNQPRYPLNPDLIGDPNGECAKWVVDNLRNRDFQVNGLVVTWVEEIAAPAERGGPGDRLFGCRGAIPHSVDDVVFGMVPS